MQNASRYNSPTCRTEKKTNLFCGDRHRKMTKMKMIENRSSVRRGTLVAVVGALSHCHGQYWILLVSERKNGQTVFDVLNYRGSYQEGFCWYRPFSSFSLAHRWEVNLFSWLSSKGCGGEINEWFVFCVRPSGSVQIQHNYKYNLFEYGRFSTGTCAGTKLVCWTASFPIKELTLASDSTWLLSMRRPNKQAMTLGA